jgi:hypothetical protein
LSKLADPTLALAHGIILQAEACRRLQAVFTTHCVYFAAWSTLMLEAQLRDFEAGMTGLRGPLIKARRAIE